MVSRRNRTLLSLSIVLGVLAWNVAAAAIKAETGVPVGNLSADDIEEQLQVRRLDCSLTSIMPLEEL
jgi:zinc transporter 7